MRRIMFLLLALAAMAAFVALGFWQLGRARWKEEYLATHAAALAAAPVPLEAALDAGADPAGALRVFGRGHFEHDATVFLDNQVQEGKTGVMVLTLFRPRGAAPPVLVNRGFIPLGPERVAPTLATTPTAEVRIEGLLVRRSLPGLKLGNAVFERGRPAPLLAYIDLDQLRAGMDARLYDGVVQLDPASPYGFAREWRALPNTLPPQRHRGYAVQWFGLAVATLAIALVLGFRRRP